MQSEITNRYGSWIISATIAVLIALWLFSGQFGDDEQVAAVQTSSFDTSSDSNSVRVRRQAAEEVTRIVSVNGRTAPARTVEL